MTATARPERYTWPLRSGDFQGGHVNNVRFQEFSQEARMAWYRERLDELGPRVPPALARSVQLEFLAPIPDGATHVWADVEVVRVGTTSFTVRSHIGSPSTGEQPVAVVDTVLVVTGEDGRPAPLTDDERRTLQAGPHTSAEAGAPGTEEKS